MALPFTPRGYRVLALACALTLPSLAQAQAGEGVPAALSAFAARAMAQGLTSADVANPTVTDSYFDASTGLTHTYLQQRVNGVAIFNATGAVHTDKTGKVVFASQDFVRGAAALAPSATPTLTAEQAITAAAVRLGLPRPVGLRVVTEARPADGLVYNNGGISERDIPVRLLYARVADKLVLVWNVTIAQLDQEHQWNARVDAQTGQLVDKNDYTVSEQSTFNQFMGRLQHKQQRALAFDAAQALAAPLSPAGTTAANSVTAFAFPLESPTQGARTNVTLPAVGNAYSPYGWVAGQSPSTFLDAYSFLSTGKYLTRGNNVAAYDDYSATANGATAASYNSSTTSPDGTSTFNFEFPFNQVQGPRANLNMATTNLFYVNNMMHDVMLAHGFDEPAGNFQYKNATGTGAGNDPVRAESQDGFARNNANFATPADGASPTMQMYLFDNVNQTITITSPSSIAGTYPFLSTTSFGGDLASLGSICGNIVPVNDGTGTNGGIHSCSPNYANSGAVFGNIALIQRAGCVNTTLSSFVSKVKNAELNGATLAIVYDSDPLATTFVNMGGADPTITIPAIFIRGIDGAKIRAALTGSTVAVGCASDQTLADLDGSLDNGVVSHEYGHGISNRLTGGPANSSCLIGNVGTATAPVYTQQMGEGWSDFFALWMTTKPGDIGSANRYTGAYIQGNTTGIRTRPYTTNFSAAGNNLTYGAVVNGNNGVNYQESHNLGEIWAATLWDLNWQFIYQYGYNTNFYAATGGNNIALKLVLDGCKLQRCNPSMLDGRDAILRADSLNNRAANSSVIWRVFARRGMGYSANAGDRTAGTPRVTGIVEAFDLPPGVTATPLATTAASLGRELLEAYPNPAQGLLTVRTQLGSAAPIQVTVLDLLGKTVVAPTSVPVAKMQQSGVELNTSALASGLYVVRVVTTDGIYTTKVTIQH
jgi:extracellular elastinolytic metalloproteinase